MNLLTLTVGESATTLGRSQQLGGDTGLGRTLSITVNDGGGQGDRLDVRCFM